MLMMLKIPILSKQKEICNKLVDERREKTIDLDEKINSDDLIYRCRGNTADVKFDEFDNALNIINKIQHGKISLQDVKKIKRNLNLILEK